MCFSSVTHSHATLSKRFGFAKCSRSKCHFGIAVAAFSGGCHGARGRARNTLGRRCIVVSCAC